MLRLSETKVLMKKRDIIKQVFERAMWIMFTWKKSHNIKIVKKTSIKKAPIFWTDNCFFSLQPIPYLLMHYFWFYMKYSNFCITSNLYHH